MTLHLESVLVGFILLAILIFLLVLLMQCAGQPVLRRLSYWMFNRRGFEKLGRPIRVRPGDTPYEQWLSNARSRIPVHECLYVDDVRSIALEPWQQLGKDIRGLYIRLADYQITDARIIEIPPLGATLATRHLFEMAVYFLGGPGHTLVYPDGKAPRRIEWNHRSVYSIPVNARYQHFSDCEKPVRLLAMTSFPFVMNSTNSEAFIFDNPVEFEDRIEAENISTAEVGRMPANHEFQDFLPDALQATLKDHSVRGKGVRNMYWTMSGNSMISINLSEMAAESIKRAHRSTSDATVLMLSGEGFAVIWPEGAWHKRIQVNWRDGTLIAQPIFWYRQFLNPGATSARNLTISASSLVKNLGLRFLDQLEIDLPGIRRLWAAERKALVKRNNDEP